MCGRFLLSDPEAVIQGLFGVIPPAGLGPRYNIAPSQQVPVFRRTGPGRSPEITLLRWGLVPNWAKDPSIGNRLVNARAETAAEKPSFRSALRRRRCLIPAEGFYEWQRVDGRKQPWLIRRRGGGGFAMAGLWEAWRGSAGPLETFTILTTRPNEVVAPLHDRMPVIVSPESFPLWLDPELQDPEILSSLLVPAPAAELEAYPVSTLVNNPANDDPHCMQPLPRT